VVKRLRLQPADLLGLRLAKRSVDARRRNAIALVYSVDLELALDPSSLRRLLRRFQGDPHLRDAPDDRYRLVARLVGPPAGAPPVVVGAGPCGYFAALLLAEMGLRPLLLERGKAVKERTADTFGFWRGQRPLDPESNVQFGEGGAGTFSDGKLYSQVSEAAPYGRKVLEELVRCGANPEILTLHHPHIGTFKLATVVRGLRARIEALGEAWLASWQQGLPAWQETPGGINLPTLLWLHNLLQAFDLEAYGRARYGLLGSGGHWFPGANADALDDTVSEAELLAVLGESPWAEAIPPILRQLRQRLGGAASQRLSSAD
jgi:hypothetical protein